MVDLSNIKVRNSGELELPSELFFSENDIYLLTEAYAGKDSEMTAISQYLYQFFLSAEYNKDIAKILEEISIVEMTHMELLGKAITRMGGNPVYASSGRFWNGSFVNYTKSLREMMYINIKGEKIAIDFYKKIIASLENISLIPVIEEIITDEETHIVAFTTILDYLNYWN